MTGLGGMLSHPFMQHAFLAGTAIALLSGLVGFFVVLRGQVFAGDALSHVAYAGALAALAAGVDLRFGLFAATVAVNWPLETKVVASAVFPHLMTEAGWKSEPFTVSVKSGSPLYAEAGLSETAVGGGAVTVNVAALETPISVSETVMLAAPCEARFAAGTVAISDVAPAKVVARALPFQHTVEAGVKPVPLT